ncbi:MAG: hypothetical protein KDI37_04850 [Xanthomonadales bacterium]|nr:hypothetical protein [Xanthomonadales bacterium]MCB1629538.1 hypothetical protein [Xanthomonadales bacterium]MCB1641040.1 hypothetical protein [Xanthomonadales bacterium]
MPSAANRLRLLTLSALLASLALLADPWPSIAADASASVMPTDGSALQQGLRHGRHGQRSKSSSTAAFEPVALWRALTGQPVQTPRPDNYSPMPDSTLLASPVDPSLRGRRSQVGRARSDRGAR